MMFKVERINEPGALNCKIGAILGQAIGIPELYSLKLDTK